MVVARELCLVRGQIAEQPIVRFVSILGGQWVHDRFPGELAQDVRRDVKAKNGRQRA